ncbi:hypothetical protein SAMN04487928_12010 [Butyrivibrio proteoclasticus]|uniref:Uncharacterized protein n=1 Tax=Butyrivibrio proteoclasticus TaxID=43305 RepID=A0A1I5W0R8_9FIRM|nr:hypothetical protein [Butyrivibrio proteoclasticus]SFQ13197.1 hypothetical protein SAMN04487928_12010 [Butyrivibrio proteoclasticus]
MNLPKFMRAVDTELESMSEQELKSCLRELARTLPENDRTHFLSIIDNRSGIVKRDSDEEKLLKKKVEDIISVLEEIGEGERCLASEYNEEWDDWYNSDDDEVFFSDPEKIVPDFITAIRLIHECVDTESYTEGYKLAKVLSSISIFADGDWDDYCGDPLGIKDLYEHELIVGPFDKLVAESLYLTYMAKESRARASEIYTMMGNFDCNDLRLEDVMQIGNHSLPEFNTFLSDWITLIGAHNDWRTKRLLKEAVSMIQDEYQALNVARTHAVTHPELFKQILEIGESDADPIKLFRIGTEALDKIPDNLTIRGEIALLTANYAGRINTLPGVELCWLEAFRSDSSVVNYLRIRFLTRVWKDYAKQVEDIIESEYAKTLSRSKSVDTYNREYILNENALYKNDYCTLLFWEKKFDEVFNLGLCEKQRLGWSGTFMKQGLAMFMLILYESEKYQSGLQSMARLAVSGCKLNADDYYKGTCDLEHKDSYSLFMELFTNLKMELDVSEDDKIKWLDKIGKIIEKRVVAIMEAERRNYYGECASFIAAFGEVIESRGQKEAKQSLMMSYKAKYPRRRSFIQALKNYGFRA